MRFALLVVGDELLSGKRQDAHLPAVARLLRARGLALHEARVVGDDEDRIAELIAEANARGEVLFVCGGIGATPDDRTRQAAARAFGRPLVRHPEAAALIEARYGERAWPQRIRMAEFPQGARLIPNPVNQVAGFSLGDCHFVPGFPDMAHPMIAWVLDRHYRHLHGQTPLRELRLRVRGPRTEGDLAGLMEEALGRWPGLRLSSLPSRGPAPGRGHIEIGFSGPGAAQARDWMCEQLGRDGALQVELLPDW